VCVSACVRERINVCVSVCVREGMRVCVHECVYERTNRQKERLSQPEEVKGQAVRI